MRFPGKLGMCPSLAEPDSGGFPRSNFEMFHVKHFVATVPPEQLQNTCFPFRFHKAERSCSPRLEKLSLFSPLAPCVKSMAQGFRCLRLVLGIPPESDSARLGHIPSLPWESQLPLKPCLSLQPSDFKGNCDFSDSLLDFCCVSLCSSVICFANVGYSPTPRQHF